MLLNIEYIEVTSVIAEYSLETYGFVLKCYSFSQNIRCDVIMLFYKATYNREFPPFESTKSNIGRPKKMSID